MRFLVPQFIDVEDKIFGPLTLRQAIYLAGGFGTAVVAFTWFGAFVGVVVGLPVVLLSSALAFVKINERPFFFLVYAIVFYMVRNKLYLWRHTTRHMDQATQKIHTSEKDMVGERIVPTLTQSRLKELAWSLDTNDTLYTNEEQWK